MGIDRTLYVWPATPSERKPGDLLHATRRLVEEHLVAPPCALVVGDIDASPGFWMNDMAFVGGDWKKVPLELGGIDPKRHRVVYNGYAVDELLGAIERTPPDPDACVVFDALDLRNAKLAAAFDKKGYSNGTVCLVDLHVEKELVVFDAYAEGDDAVAEHSARRLFVVSGKSGPDSIAGAPLKRVLEELFGKKPIVACTQS